MAPNSPPAPPGARKATSLHLDIDPKSHPAWTGGQQQLLDRGGRLSRFQKRFSGFLKANEQEISAVALADKKAPPARGFLFSGLAVPQTLSAPKAALSRPSWRSTGLADGLRRSAACDCGSSRRAGAPWRAACATARSGRAAPPATARALVGSCASLRCEFHLALFLARLRERHLAFFDRAMQQQPGGELHQPRGETHAFGGVGKRRARVRVSWIPAGRDRRDRSRSPRPAPCPHGTNRRMPANSPAVRRTTPFAFR